MDALTRIAGALGSDLYDGADTYTIEGETPNLKEKIRSIFIREDQAAMITSLYLDILGTKTEVTDRNIVGADLIKGDLFTLPYSIVEITTAGGSFIGYEG